MKNMIFPTITEKEACLPFYLAGVGCNYEQEHIVRPEGYPNFQWIQCIEGKGAIVISDIMYSLCKGQGILLYPNEAHEYYSISENWKVDWIIFGGHQLIGFFQDVGMRKTQIYNVFQPDLLLTKIRSVLNIATTGINMWGLDCSILVYDILINLTKHTSEEGTNSALHRHSKLRPVFDYIGNNYSKQITLNELSDIVNISPQHLCVLFRNTINSRVFEYINNVRIQKSKEFILTCKSMNIKEIAKLSGFEDFSYFCCVFKKIERTSPGKFKKLYGS